MDSGEPDRMGEITIPEVFAISFTIDGESETNVSPWAATQRSQSDVGLSALLREDVAENIVRAVRHIDVQQYEEARGIANRLLLNEDFGSRYAASLIYHFVGDKGQENAAFSQAEMAAKGPQDKAIAGASIVSALLSVGYFHGADRTLRIAEEAASGVSDGNLARIIENTRIALDHSIREATLKVYGQHPTQLTDA